jgi:hypothetical protein
MKIHAKWGFGNAPLKTHHREKTHAAIDCLLSLLERLPDSATPEQLEAISHVKGQFTRTTKQDQWDWYTVWELLGRPSRRPASKISKQLGALRAALKGGQSLESELIRADLIATGIERYLRNFLAGERDNGSGPSGFIYILSTRSQPGILKIGMTLRTVVRRVKEINAATGVVIPYGVRASWRVDDAAEVERDIHGLLAQYRVRADREFFEIEFNEASRLVNDYLNERRRLRRAQAGDSEPYFEAPSGSQRIAD